MKDNNICILLKHNRNWGLQDGVVEKFAIKALEEKGFTKNVELSIYFVGRKKAKQLNQDYRDKDYIPQVLGFPMSTIEIDSDGVIRLGDIVICTQKLKYEAKFQNKKINEVLYEWLIHGVENLMKG